MDNKTVVPQMEPVADKFNPSVEEAYVSFPDSNVKSSEIYSGVNEPLGNKDAVKG